MFFEISKDALKEDGTKERSKQAYQYMHANALRYTISNAIILSMLNDCVNFGNKLTTDLIIVLAFLRKASIRALIALILT